MSTESYYTAIVTSREPMERITLAATSFGVRRRQRTIESLRSIARGSSYWSHSNNGVLDELAEELAIALLHTIEDASHEHSPDSLIEGIERHMFSSPEIGEAGKATQVINECIERFELGNAWSDADSEDSERAAMMELGNAIAIHGWRHDRYEAGLGSPHMVATIAYLRAL